jgi:hypothetical protein
MGSASPEEKLVTAAIHQESLGQRLRWLKKVAWYAVHSTLDPPRPELSAPGFAIPSWTLPTVFHLKLPGPNRCGGGCNMPTFNHSLSGHVTHAPLMFTLLVSVVSREKQQHVEQ